MDGGRGPWYVPPMPVPVRLFLLGAIVFASLAGKRLIIHSQHNHFVYLAHAFVEGQLELVRKPHHQNDWASYDVLTLKGASAKAHGESVKGFFTRRAGKPDEFRLLDGSHIEVPRRDRGPAERKYFVSFPPLPAVLMIPFFLLVGYGTNDVVFSVLFAALNVPLAWMMLRQLAACGYSERSPTDDLWLTAMLVFGTAHLWVAAQGTVWFTALVVGLTFNLLYMLFAVDARRPLLAGLALACAFSTRASLVFASLFFFHQLFTTVRDADGRRDWAGIARRGALFVAPCLAVGISLLLYNYARFEKFTEFGHTYLATGTIARIRDFGLFHPAFLERNLHAAFTLLPRFQGWEWPFVKISKHGMSLFLTTPALVWALWPRRRTPISLGLLLAALAVLTPILFYQNTGWLQFGFRFSIDFLPYVVALLAVGGPPLSRAFKAAVVLGVLINWGGAAIFERDNRWFAEFGGAEPKR